MRQNDHEKSKVPHDENSLLECLSKFGRKMRLIAPRHPESLDTPTSCLSVNTWIGNAYPHFTCPQRTRHDRKHSVRGNAESNRGCHG